MQDLHRQPQGGADPGADQGEQVFVSPTTSEVDVDDVDLLINRFSLSQCVRTSF